MKVTNFKERAQTGQSLVIPLGKWRAFFVKNIFPDFLSFVIFDMLKLAKFTWISPFQGKLSQNRSPSY